jgi:putative membrane protein
MSHPFLQLLLRWSILALGVTIAANVVPGIACDDATTLVIVVLVLSFFNAVLRPLLVLFTLPFILVTMGLGIVLINAFLFLMVGKLVDGFYVASFWSALGGALIVGVTSLILNKILVAKRGPRGGKPGPAVLRANAGVATATSSTSSRRAKRDGPTRGLTRWSPCVLGFKFDRRDPPGDGGLQILCSCLKPRNTI